MFLDQLRSKYPHILDTIRKEKVLTDKIDAELKQILTEFIPSAGLKMRG